MLNRQEFARRRATLKAGANLRISDFAHATAEGVPNDQALVYYSLALEILVAREGDRFSGSLIRTLGRKVVLLVPRSLLRCVDNCLGLVAEISCEFTVRRHSLCD